MSGFGKLSLEKILSVWPDDIDFNMDAPWPVFLEAAQALKSKASKCIKFASRIRAFSGVLPKSGSRSENKSQSTTSGGDSVASHQFCELPLHCV